MSCYNLNTKSNQNANDKMCSSKAQRVVLKCTCNRNSGNRFFRRNKLFKKYEYHHPPPQPFTALFKYTKQISKTNEHAFNEIASALVTLSNISYWGFNVGHTYCESKQMLKLNYTPSTRPQKDVIRKDAKVKGAIKQHANRCSIFANNQNSEEQQKHKKQQLLFWEKA